MNDTNPPHDMTKTISIMITWHRINLDQSKATIFIVGL